MSPAMFMDLLIILTAGFVAGLLCRLLRISMLIGYLLAGALIGSGGLGWIMDQHHEVENLAEFGVLLLLFSIGLEFSLEELIRIGRHILVGGGAQMLLVAGPAIMVLRIWGVDWAAAVLLGFALAMSSTVLVFKVLTEYGLMSTRGGRRAVSILLFQDIAVVPLLLLIPILTGNIEQGLTLSLLLLLGKTIAVVVGTYLLREAMQRWVVPLLARLRSPELIVLFAMLVLGVLVLVMHEMGLPLPLGAFFAGLIFSGNRLSGQVDALVLSFREVFAAVFFVSLGLLFKPGLCRSEPFLTIAGFTGLVLLKWAAGTLAVRFTRMRWRGSLGVGLGLAHVGEFAFVLAFAALQAELISEPAYHRLLLYALISLLLTPQMIRFGMRWSEPAGWPEQPPERTPHFEPATNALVVGIGPVGRQVITRLEQKGIRTCAIDLSPVNLHPLAQRGLFTVAGDASSIQTLRNAGAAEARLAVICVPADEVAQRIVSALHSLNPACTILVRCRYLGNVTKLENAGAQVVISEEAEASGALLGALPLDMQEA